MEVLRWTKSRRLVPVTQAALHAHLDFSFLRFHLSCSFRRNTNALALGKGWRWCYFLLGHMIRLWYTEPNKEVSEHLYGTCVLCGVLSLLQWLVGNQTLHTALRSNSCRERQFLTWKLCMQALHVGQVLSYCVPLQSSVFTSACTGFPRTWSRALAKHTRHSAVEADAHWSCTPVILLYGVVLCWPTFPCEISALWDRLSPLYSELLELRRPELGLTVTSLFVFEMCC